MQHSSSALGFLGVGIPPPMPTWNNMPADPITALVSPWWLVLVPGLAITVTALAFNLLGDGIRDTLDPCLLPAFLRLVAGSSRKGAGGPGPGAGGAGAAEAVAVTDCIVRVTERRSPSRTWTMRRAWRRPLRETGPFEERRFRP